MSPILAAILISTNLITFFSFLSLKVDQSIKWNWFVVFIPMFLLNFLFLAHSVILLKRHLRHKLSGELLQLVVYILCNLLVLAFEILLCIKMEYHFSMLTASNVLAPLWILLIILILFLFNVLAK